MKFSEAMKLLEEGKKVKTKGWGKGYYIQLVNGKLVDEEMVGFELINDHFRCEWEEYIESEIIEPSEKKIEKLSYEWTVTNPTSNEVELLEITRLQLDKINELIEVVNELC